MRAIAFALALICGLAGRGMAFEIENRVVFGPEDPARVLSVISTGDAELFAPIIQAFLQGRPDVAVDYTVASSAQLMRAVHEEGVVFDVVLSSAMDLQTKLVNDGFARAYSSGVTEALPDWARWRQHLFAFTEEPAAIVLSREAFEGLDLPRTRQGLIELMRAQPERFAGRVGTYDVRQSGLGYLFATQDARTSETFWRLSEVMGALKARLYCCSGQMIDDVASGELALAYNVLGSYARGRADRSAFHILLPEDFVTVMLRTAFIARTSPEPDLAEAFIDHLVARDWADGDSADGDGADGDGADGDSAESAFFDGNWLRPQEQVLRRIRMGPGLMVFLDRYKKAAFIEEWGSAMLQP